MLTIFYGSFSHAGQSFIIAATPKGICFVGSPDGTISELTTFLPQTKLVANQAAIAPYSESLTAYLDGDQTTWSLPIDIIGGTPFQRSVWTALQAVPYGQTTTYSALAAQGGHPTAIRAVASAIGRNPLLMIIPCHRVYREDGQIGGYRGGLELKQTLHQLETQTK